MDRDEYDRKYRQEPGAQQTDAQKAVDDGVMLPIQPDDLETRRQLEAAGYDYEGSEEWEEFMEKMGRRRS